MTGEADVVPREARTIGFTELKTWLRHRHPMIYLDRVLDYEPGQYLSSLMLVSGQIDAVAGHFPERAVYPASHVLQAVSQSAIILYQLSTSQLADDELTLVGSVKARFTQVIVPGDQVVFDTTAERCEDRTFWFSCRANVGGSGVATVRGTLVRRQIAELGNQLW